MVHTYMQLGTIGCTEQTVNLVFTVCSSGVPSKCFEFSPGVIPVLN